MEAIGCLCSLACIVLEMNGVSGGSFGSWRKFVPLGQAYLIQVLHRAPSVVQEIVVC